MPIQSLSIDDPVVLSSDLSPDYTFSFYSRIAGIINNNGEFKYILGDGKIYDIQQLRVPNQEEMISYFSGYVDPIRNRARSILEQQ